MGKWIAGILGTVIAGLLLAYSLDAFGPTKRQSSDANAGGIVPPPPPPKDEEVIVVMGALEERINRQGNDFSAIEKPAANAPLCAEMCRTDAKCDSMTYVKSTGMCWTKTGVPAATANADMVSSVKVRKTSTDASM